MDGFKCLMPKVLFGRGRLAELGPLAAEAGRRAFLAVDPFMEESGLADAVSGQLKEAGLEVLKHSRIEPDPDCFGVDEAAGRAREAGADLVVAVGGGSALDFGKGVAVVAAGPGACWEYTRRRDHTPRVPGAATLPLIAVPTTAGTGSEMTPFAVFTNSRLREKSTIVSERIIPRLTVVDPALTHSCPPSLTALTGVDVLAHAVEATINIQSSPFARLTALEAVRLTARWLPVAVANGSHREARERMSWAASLAGVAIAHANPTLPHALGQAAGGFMHAPHGASVAAMLAPVMRLSFSADVERFGELAAAMEPASAALPAYERAERSVELVERLLRDIGVQVRLGDFGLKEADIPRVTEIALTGYFTGISLHPKQVDGPQIQAIYRACL